jgi:hypothetical protein
VSPDGRILFDTVAEVTQACTAEAGGDLFDVVGGCTIVINQNGEVRYTITKKVPSRERLDRQVKAMRGPLKDFWLRTKAGAKYRFTPQKDLFRLVHGGGH